MVVEAYGKFLEETPYGVGLSLPADSLPYDIHLIKEALTQQAAASSDGARISMLHAGFMELAAIQADYRPSALLADRQMPQTRGEIKNFYGVHDDELSAMKDIAEKIEQTREVLTGEWQLRLEMQKVADAERLVD